MAILTEPASTRQSTIMAVVVCFLISFLEGFDLQAAGIAAPKLASELGISAKLLGLFFAVATIGIIVGAYIGGRPDLGRSIHPMLESGPTALVQNNPAHPFEGSAHALILPRGVTLHRLDIDAVEQPMKLFGR
jgi:hypothetical protein